jgi:hypothetical protein
MIALIQWALVVLGVIYFVTESVIFGPVRVTLTRGSVFRSTLLYCPACMGFWVGVASGFLQPALWQNPVQSGLAAMALGRIWALCGGGGNTFATELHMLHIDTEETHDTQKEAQDV